MAYEKHTWETGETITAEKLNNLEDGVSSVKYVNVNVDANTGEYFSETGDFYYPIVCEKTYNELVDMLTNNVVIAKIIMTNHPMNPSEVFTSYAILSQPCSTMKLVTGNFIEFDIEQNHTRGNLYNWYLSISGWDWASSGLYQVKVF